MKEVDENFYKRADEHIRLSNEQINDEVTLGKVSSSNMFATARFNAWVSASGWNNSDEMAKNKEETLEYFVTQYKKMLEENLDDYIENFDSYMKPPA
ncbi:DUF3144 domain-containing protein [Marinicellulosiphila megalodicopiae]|uniref:DUF3144 domain-containing protein n=1 Tax=Marinicellulosiphila megalodicopiae TaxID=2724896 RepID=UPI003BB05B59